MAPLVHADDLWHRCARRWVSLMHSIHFGATLAVSASLLNVVLHGALVIGGAVPGPTALTMLGGAVLCLTCLPALTSRQPSIRPWVALAIINALMLATHVIV